MSSNYPSRLVSPELSLLIRSLPQRQRFDVRSLSTLYGADWLAAAYCCLQGPPIPPEGIWQHGWIPRHCAISPATVICGDGDYNERKDTEKFSVARRDQERYLGAAGYRHVRAIGLPVAYLPDCEQPRLQGRLLVMPVHSDVDTVLLHDFDAYAADIDSIRSNFEEVVICVHPACFAKGYWVNSFQRLGFPVIEGSSYDDRNGLLRLQRLLKGFEFVTTNGFGSHLAYGAFFGAKVSIYGREADQTKEEYLNRPALAASDPADWEVASRKTLSRVYPFLIQEPWKAQLQCDWGQREVGAENKLTPSELMEWFGWTKRHIFEVKTAQLFRNSKAQVWQTAGHLRRLVTDPLYRESQRLFARVENLAEGTSATVELDGKPFTLPASRGLANQYRELFLEQTHRLPATVAQPLLVDGRAHYGLLAASFLSQFPGGRVIAFEPEQTCFDYLQRNLSVRNPERSRAIKGVPWHSSGPAVWLSRSIQGLRVLARDTEYEGENIETSAIGDLSDGTEIHLLRLELLDQEALEILGQMDCLLKVKTFVLEYFSPIAQPQSLGKVLSLIETAGFRLHIFNPEPSPQPLYQRRIESEFVPYDLHLRIFAFR